MKKILAIIVIGLILNTSAYANNMIKTGKKKFDYEIRYADYNEFIVTYNLGIVNTWNFYDTRFVDLAKDHCFKFGKSVVLYYKDSPGGLDIILHRKLALRAHCFSFTEMRGLVEAGNQSFFLKHSFLRKIAWEKQPDFKHQIGNIGIFKETPSLLARDFRIKRDELKAIVIKPDGKTFTTSLRTAWKDFGINNNEKNLTAKNPKQKKRLNQAQMIIKL